MSYDFVADTPTDAEMDYLGDVRPDLVAGHFDFCPSCNKLDPTCDCAMQLALAQRYTLANIPPAYWTLGWRDFNPQVPPEIGDYQQHAEGYVRNGVGLLLASPKKGIGKTMLSILILKDLVKAGHQCYYRLVAELPDAITAGWGPNPSAKAASVRFVDQFERSRVLLLDDLGKEFKSSNPTSITAQTFDRILRSRVQNQRPTFLTTNLTVSQLTTGYGESVYSLLVEQSIPVKMTGVDFRHRAADRALALGRSGRRPPIV